MGSKREQLETLNMWGQKLTREEGLTNADKDNIHKDLALINERFNKVYHLKSTLKVNYIVNLLVSS